MYAGKCGDALRSVMGMSLGEEGDILIKLDQSCSARSMSSAMDRVMDRDLVTWV